jgi:hypothetical protein
MGRVKVGDSFTIEGRYLVNPTVGECQCCHAPMFWDGTVCGTCRVAQDEWIRRVLSWGLWSMRVRFTGE